MSTGRQVIALRLTVARLNPHRSPSLGRTVAAIRRDGGLPSNESEPVRLHTIAGRENHPLTHATRVTRLLEGALSRS